MNQARRPVNSHKAFHAHVYFDEVTSDFARSLCGEAGAQFGLAVGRHHEKLVGPHPRWSCQISFGTKDFDAFIPWLDSHRQGLTILVHGLTGDHWKDHTDHAYWLGDAVTLNLDFFKTMEQGN
jgi:DOPA 4,5-dioxygenase